MQRGITTEAKDIQERREYECSQTLRKMCPREEGGERRDGKGVYVMNYWIKRYSRRKSERERAKLTESEREREVRVRVKHGLGGRGGRERDIQLTAFNALKRALMVLCGFLEPIT